MKKGDVVAWKRPLADLICTVQGVEGDTVSLCYLHAHKNEPLFVAKVNEVVRLSGPQEEEFSANLLEAVERQRRIDFPPPRKRREKKDRRDKQLKRREGQGD